MTPIKRTKALQPLSHEHHQGLLLCFGIRQGFKKSIEVERIKTCADWFFSNHLAPHFKTEEELIFPILGNDNDLVKRALADHRRLIRLFNDQSSICKSLSLIEEELEKHIRFEERILFSAIENAASNQEIDLIMKAHKSINDCGTWRDKFWI